MKKGRCCICGKMEELTYEHIPPAKAFNSDRAKVITGDELIKTVTDENRLPWEYDHLKYNNQQRGMGLYSLCQSCNNLTGTLYGNDYIMMAKTVFKLMSENKIENEEYVKIIMKEVPITRFARQVLSMFCSTCKGLSNKYPIMKELILNKDLILKEKPDFRISMFILKNYRIAYTGINALLTMGQGIKTVAEVDAYPFGFILELDPEGETDNVDITSFLEYKYDDKVDLEMGIKIRERNIIFPIDYRKKEEFK